MRAVVDTNVIAYFLLGTDGFREECEQFWREVADAFAPASWETELTNVLWMAARKQVIDLPEALRKLELAKGLGIQSIAVGTLWSVRAGPSARLGNRRLRRPLRRARRSRSGPAPRPSTKR